MTHYAVGHLRQVDMGPGIVAYLENIDSTLAPFGGHFIVHGGTVESLEGGWQGDLIVIAFPDRDAAMGWDRSEAYQAILHHRRDNAQGDIFLIDGVDADHKATDILNTR